MQNAGSAVRQRKYHVEQIPNSDSIAAILAADAGHWSTSWRKIRTSLPACASAFASHDSSETSA